MGLLLLLVSALGLSPAGSKWASADPSALDLRILEPVDGSVFEPGTSRVEIRGLLRGDPAARLSVNGRTVTRSGDHWSFGSDLVVGLNAFEVVATSAQGQVIVERLRVRLRDPSHGLALASRKRGFGADLGIASGAKGSERIDFVDTTTGAAIRRLAGSPSLDRPHYTDHGVWSADGSTLVFYSNRGPAGSWLVGARGSAPQHLSLGGAHWDPVDPGLLYAVDHRQQGGRKVWYVRRHHVDAPRREPDVLFDFPSLARRLNAAVIQVHPDGRRLLAGLGVQNRTGIPSWLFLIDSKSGEAARLRVPGTAHRVLFTRSDRYGFFFNLAVERAGSGRLSMWCGPNVAASACRRAAEGGFLVEAPLEHLLPDRSGLLRISPDSICRISSQRVSHPAFPPGGARILSGYGQNLFDADDEWVWHTGIAVSKLSCMGDLGVERSLHWGVALGDSPNSGHRSWSVDRKWLLDHTGSQIRRIDTDGWYATPIVTPHTQEGRGDYDANTFPVLSPDGTKVAFSSTMLGDVDLYTAVVRLPEPPQSLRIDEPSWLFGGGEVLRWKAPSRSKELAGYEILGASRSGGPYRRMTVDPVEESRWRVPGDAPPFLMVRAVEHSGLAGRPSSEIARSTAAAQRRVLRVEAESGRMTRPFALVFDGDLAGLYSVRTHGPIGGRVRGESGAPGPGPIPEAAVGKLELDVLVPRTGRYWLWAYTRGPRGGHFELRGPGGEVARLDASSNGWRWQRARQGQQDFQLPLVAGLQSISLTSPRVGSEIDQLVLTDDPAHRPEGPAVTLPLEPASGPREAPQQVEARALSPYTCRLMWAAPRDGGSGVVEVRRDSVGAPGVAELIASRQESPFVDDGLRPGEHHHYTLRRVTLDGAAGRTAEVECTTPKRVRSVRQDLDVSRLAKSWQLRFDVTQSGQYAIWVLLSARSSHPTSRQIELCLDRARGTCRTARALHSERWKLPLGPISLSECCPPPLVPGERLWVPLPLSEVAPRQVAALEPGSHQVTLWPDDLDGFEICAALLTNDLSFLPGDDPQLPEAPWSYTSTSRSARSAHAGLTTIRSDTGECTALRPRRDSTR